MRAMTQRETPRPECWRGEHLLLVLLLFSAAALAVTSGHGQGNPMLTGVRLCAAACAVFGAGTVLSEPSGTAQTGADPGGGLCPAVGRADGGALLDGGGQSERSSVLTLAEIWFALAVFCVGHLYSPGRLAVRQ